MYVGFCITFIGLLTRRYIEQAPGRNNFDTNHFLRSIISVLLKAYTQLIRAYISQRSICCKKDLSELVFRDGLDDPISDHQSLLDADFVNSFATELSKRQQQKQKQCQRSFWLFFVFYSC